MSRLTIKQRLEKQKAALKNGWARIKNVVGTKLEQPIARVNTYGREMLDIPLDKIRLTWSKVVKFADEISPLIPTTLIILAGGFLMIKTPQGQDVVANIVTANFVQRTLFVVSIFLNGFLAWYCSRQVLDVVNPIRDHRRGSEKYYLIEERPKTGRIDLRPVPINETHFVRRWVPIILGVLPFIFALISMWTHPAKTQNISSPFIQIFNVTTLAICVIGITLTWLIFPKKQLTSNNDTLDSNLNLGTRFRVQYRPIFLAQEEFESLRSGHFKNPPMLEVFLAPAAHIVSFIGVLAALSFTTAFIFFPFELPVFLGSATVAFFAFAIFIAISSALVRLSYRFQIPALLIIAFLMFLDSCSIGKGHLAHKVRAYEGFNANKIIERKLNINKEETLGMASGINVESTLNPEGRDSIEEALIKWLDMNDRVSKKVKCLKPHVFNLKTSQCASEDEGVLATPVDIPIVFVSIMGGASRASYWSSVVLSSLEETSISNEEDVQEFHKSVFTISSISGGSLGAAAFNSVLKSEYARTDFSKSITEFAGQDYLSPAIAGMMYYDLYQDFVPLVQVPDRSEGLERAFEKGWERLFKQAVNICRSKGKSAKSRENMETSETIDYRIETIKPLTKRQCAEFLTNQMFAFRRPFLDLHLYEDKAEEDCLTEREGKIEKNKEECIGWIPALMLIGTHQQTGKRIITGHIKPPENMDVLDFYELSKSNIRTSTAVMNSARFPIVSPPGLIRQKVKNGEEIFHGHVLDGGYFEDGGIDTTIGIYRDVNRALRNLELESLINLEPIFIEINTSDVSAPGDLARFDCSEGDCSQDSLDTYKPTYSYNGFMNELIGPIKGLLNSRNARSILSAKRLSSMSNKDYGPSGNGSYPKYYTFNLCRGLPVSGSDPQTAMSWALSTVSKVDIDTIFFPEPKNLPAHLKKQKRDILISRNLRNDDCSQTNRETRDAIIKTLEKKEVALTRN